MCVQDEFSAPPPRLPQVHQARPGQEIRCRGHMRNSETVRALLDAQPQQTETHLGDWLRTLLMCLWVFVERAK